MEPDDPPGHGGRLETFDVNERFVVVRDEDGYAVWRLEELGECDPIERFTDDDDGYEAAAERWKMLTRLERRARRPWMRRLRIAIIVSASVWALTSLAATTLFIWNFALDEAPFPQGSIDVWLQAIGGSGFPVTSALLSIYLVLWMEERRTH